MASMDPSEDEISQVIEVAGISPVDDRSLVIQALKSNNRSVEAVVMQWFDNPESFRQKYQMTWDDSMFAADRDGGNNNAGISFHIESPGHNDIIQGVTPPPDSYAPGAPSRPPSRTNSRSPLGRMVDWTAESATGMPNSQAQEDEDMQRALRESAQEAGITMDETEPSGLEASASAPYFGPANRNDYDQANWALVPFGEPKPTLGSVPKPSLRKRTPGAPAFLVNSNNAAEHRLGSLLTILHEIPFSRNILLDFGAPAATYGHNSEWWKGQEILAPQVLARMQTGQLQWGKHEQEKSDFEAELHRLMAFLDSTDRSYGTAGVLADLIPFSNLGAEKQFYEMLGERANEQTKPLAQVAALAEIYNDGPGYEEATFGILEVEHTRSEYSDIKTLYEALDHVMWNESLGWHDIHEEAKMAMFKEMGDVLVIKFGRDGPEEAIEIPDVFYPERYLLTRKAEARRIQIGWCKTKKDMSKVVAQQTRIQRWKDNWNNQTFDKRDLIKNVNNQWVGYQGYLESLARFQEMERSGFDTDKYPDYRLAPCNMDEKSKEQSDKVNDMIKLSEKLLAALETRLQGLRDDLERIKARQRFLGKLLTDPNKAGRPEPMTCSKYLLRGVATSTDVMYICRRSEANLIELEDEPSEPLDQWWRLAFTPDEEQPVKAEKVGIEQVFRNMWEETKTPLLVYATEMALDIPLSPLTSQLERFVKAENKAFRQELNQEKTESNETRRATFVDPISPSKRKHRSDSADSMDSNRASLGSEDRVGLENPFSDEPDRDMEEISARTIEFARSASIDSVTGRAPHMSSWDPPSTGTTSATMPSTPKTNAAGEDKNQEDVQLIDIQSDSTQTMTPGTEQPKVPEMQERSRPPSFMTRTMKDSGKEEVMVMDMNMDIDED
ncbi:hypothetical protein BGZ63DRAFT_356951 [Mariannaea sp. PMI_226]|nr:hypothetical protein BGZ63DRAFT_356951 [Mariannaea sp. PMI_226]